jgi:hypothetical protein
MNTEYRTLWSEVSTIVGNLVPTSTFRYWISEVCLLPLKQTYTESEAFWIREWAKTYIQFPRRSPKAKLAFHQRIKEQPQDSTIENPRSKLVIKTTEYIP